jgi:hypothetical protein
MAVLAAWYLTALYTIELEAGPVKTWPSATPRLGATRPMRSFWSCDLPVWSNLTDKLGEVFTPLQIWLLRLQSPKENIILRALLALQLHRFDNLHVAKQALRFTREEF